jgi:CIC family chloride channel protein
MQIIRRYVRLWKEIVRSYRSISSFRWLILGVVAGVLSGLAAVLFFLGVEAGKHVFLNMLAGLNLPAPAAEEVFHSSPAELYRPWLIPVGLTIVGLITGFMVKNFFPESLLSGTDGTDATIKAFHNQEGRIKPRVWISRTILAILTISTGGSAGREGPITQAGAGIGSWLADKLHLSVRERRILLLAGAAGGLGAIFRAPLGGALTAIEVIYHEDFEAEAVLPSVLSSVASYTIFTMFFGTEPILTIPAFHFSNPVEIIFYVALAVVCSISGWMYVQTFRFVKYSVFFKLRERVGIVWSIGLGGLVMGLIGMFFPQVLTGGYGWLEMAVLGQLPLLMMLAILMGKIVATSVTLGSGFSGGMFAPALFVGGLSGGLVGKVSAMFFPNVVTQPGGYVLVGMAAFFAGVAKAPVGPLIMVCELTQGYGLLAPLMLSSALCIILTRKSKLYENQVGNKFDSPAHIEDATINILEEMHVADHYKSGRVTVLEESMTLKALLDIVANTNNMYFPVRGAQEKITGILPLQDVRKVLFEDCLMDLIVVRDLMRKPVSLHPRDNLYKALLAFVDTNYGEIPVLEPGDDTTVLGILNREDVFHAYSKAIKEIRQEAL